MSDITLDDEIDPRDELGRKLRQAAQLSRHLATHPHPLEMRDLLADLLADTEALWLSVEDDGQDVRT